MRTTGSETNLPGGRRDLAFARGFASRETGSPRGTSRWAFFKRLGRRTDGFSRTAPVFSFGGEPQL